MLHVQFWSCSLHRFVYEDCLKMSVLVFSTGAHVRPPCLAQGYLFRGLGLPPRILHITRTEPSEQQIDLSQSQFHSSIIYCSSLATHPPNLPPITLHNPVHRLRPTRSLHTVIQLWRIVFSRRRLSYLLPHKAARYST